jgi:hypothetical protein
MKKKLIVIICVFFMLEISCTTIPELKLVPVDNTENTSQNEVTTSNSTSLDQTLSDEEIVEAEPTSDAQPSSESVETDMVEIKEGLPKPIPEFFDSGETSEVTPLEEEIPIKVLTSDRTLSDEKVVEAEPTSDAQPPSELVETDMVEIKEGLPEPDLEFSNSGETSEVAPLEEEISIKVLTSDRTLSDEEIVEAEPTSYEQLSSEPIETDMVEIKEGLPEPNPEFSDSVETSEVAPLEEEIPIKVLTSDRTLSDEKVVEPEPEPEPEPLALDPLVSISEQERENVETNELVLPNEKLREENNSNSTEIIIEIPISDKSEVLLEDRNVTGNQQLEVIDSANEIKTSNDLDTESLDVTTEPIVSPIDPEEIEKLDVVDIQEVDIQESHNELPQLIELDSIEEPVSRQSNQSSTPMIIWGGGIVSLLVLIILFLIFFKPDFFHRFKEKYFLLVSWTHKRIDYIKNIKANWEQRRSNKDFTKSERSTVDVKSDESQDIQESKLNENGEDEHI